MSGIIFIPIGIFILFTIIIIIFFIKGNKNIFEKFEAFKNKNVDSNEDNIINIIKSKLKGKEQEFCEYCGGALDENGHCNSCGANKKKE